MYTVYCYKTTTSATSATSGTSTILLCILHGTVIYNYTLNPKPYLTLYIDPI